MNAYELSHNIYLNHSCHAYCLINIEYIKLEAFSRPGQFHYSHIHSNSDGIPRWFSIAANTKTSDFGITIFENQISDNGENKVAKFAIIFNLRAFGVRERERYRGSFTIHLFLHSHSMANAWLKNTINHLVVRRRNQHFFHRTNNQIAKRAIQRYIVLIEWGHQYKMPIFKPSKFNWISPPNHAEIEEPPGKTLYTRKTNYR